MSDTTLTLYMKTV